MNLVLKALSDSTRRGIIDAVHAEPGLTLTDLTERSELSRFGVMKHIKVLQEAGLLDIRRDGRFKRHFLTPDVLSEELLPWIDALMASKGSNLRVVAQ